MASCRRRIGSLLLNDRTTGAVVTPPCVVDGDPDTGMITSSITSRTIAVETSACTVGLEDGRLFNARFGSAAGGQPTG